MFHIFLLKLLLFTGGLEKKNNWVQVLLFPPAFLFLSAKWDFFGGGCFWEYPPVFFVSLKCVCLHTQGVNMEGVFFFFGVGGSVFARIWSLNVSTVVADKTDTDKSWRYFVVNSLATVRPWFQFLRIMYKKRGRFLNRPSLTIRSTTKTTLHLSVLTLWCLLNCAQLRHPALSYYSFYATASARYRWRFPTPSIVQCGVA